MKERSILFNGDMVRAILDGRKTQTRRVMKIQPSANFSPMNMALELDYNARWYHPGIVDKDGYLQPAKKQVFGVADEDEGYACPLGAVGDRLWVRETFRLFDKYQECGCSDFPCNCPAHNTPIYRASNKDCEDKWTPSIHMPRWASRITLEITNVGVQRLNSISQKNAAREGIHKLPASGRYCITPGAQYFGGASHDAREVFSWLWQSIYGEESWRANPWVWVIEFKLMEKAQ
ncbi:TPA: hypothetical protein ACSTJZ_001385 [Serratia fonticola]